MPYRKKVADLMIRLEDYPHVPYWYARRQAMAIVREAAISDPKVKEASQTAGSEVMSPIKVAFARRQENSWIVAAAGRLFTKFSPTPDISLHPEVWQEDFLSLPDDAPRELVNIFTGETIKSRPRQPSKALDLADLFQNLPVALLFGRAD